MRTVAVTDETPEAPKDSSLAPVRVDAARVIGTTIGLRPFRPEGFVVRVERRGRTRIVHNYGHGGCGISLSWGTAAMVWDLLRDRPPHHATVIGAGAVGLATAHMLQRQGTSVTVRAAAFPPETTSSAAGAFWAPFTLFDAERLTPALAVRVTDAARRSYHVFSRLAEDARYGVRRLPLYYLDEARPELSPEMRLVPELFDGPLLTPRHSPFRGYWALRLVGLAIEPARYLAALREDVELAGGRFVQQSLEDLDPTDGRADVVVVNCTGLGSRELAGDTTLAPVRGHLVLLEPQPEVDYMVMAPRQGLYMLPRRDAIVLGTTHERGQWSLEPDDGATQRLLAGHHALFDRMT